jgi:hypothetical protein
MLRDASTDMFYYGHGTEPDTERERVRDRAREKDSVRKGGGTANRRTKLIPRRRSCGDVAIG